jgi:transcription antitermination factor NusG
LQTSSIAHDVSKWYAVRVKSRFEKTVSDALRHKGYSEFCPTYAETHQWSDRLKRIYKPLFPGYVFCRFDVNNRLPILITPGVVGIAGFGKMPVPVESHEIQTIETIVTSGVFAEPAAFCSAGDRVRIEHGPLAGVEGIVVQVRNAYRIVVSVTLLQRSVSAEVDRSWLRPLDTRPRPRLIAVQSVGPMVEQPVLA